ncbi:MAG: GGDEF domain-containing response regulator [Nitrospirae bacterium]|nr:GGDEF domain-containing response regulator [Nitrospirota bacterium]
MSDATITKILFVEDNAADALWVHRALASFEDFAFQCVHQKTLAEALLHLELNKMDVILMDLSLPDSMGLDTFHQLRAKVPDTPILVLSGVNDEDVAVAAVQHGAQDYLVKDHVTKDSLHRSIRYSIERNRSQQHLAYLAHYDQLTGLPNRGLFFDRFGQAVKRARRSEQLVALLFVDLDHFKDINDSIGHQAADIMLKRVADRLRACLRDCDTVSRMGGDEFALVLEDIASIQQLSVVAKRILQHLAEPFLIEDREIYTSVSVGITIFPFDDNEEGILLQHADIAMHQAKHQGGNTYQYYLGGMGAQVANRSSLANDLRQGLAKDEFFLHYQPLVDLKTSRIIGVESLARWQHPTRGLIPPGQFIPVAEQIGFIGRLGQWVLQKACTDMGTISQDGMPEIPVAVNVSGRQFRNKNLVEKIQMVLDQSAMAPGMLELELTENVLMDDSSNHAATLDKIKKMGVKISIDDFGTGYSSFRYLQTFPIDTLKIDRSFILDLPHNGHNASLVASMIDMGHSLGLTVLAEGVETEEQVKFLQAHDCDRAQGFYFARPQSLDALMPTLMHGHVPAPALN